jgi:hypothetical protein
MLDTVSWQNSSDDTGASADITLRREHMAFSVAPLMTASAFNKAFSPSGAYGALLALAREVKIEVALTAPGVPPSSGDWLEVFRGRIDSIDPASGDQVQLSCRDLGGYLADLFLEEEYVLSYGSVSGSPVAMIVWQPNRSFALGDYILPTDGQRNGRFYKCTTAGRDRDNRANMADRRNGGGWHRRAHVPGDHHDRRLLGGVGNAEPAGQGAQQRRRHRRHTVRPDVTLMGHHPVQAGPHRPARGLADARPADRLGGALSVAVGHQPVRADALRPQPQREHGRLHFRGEHVRRRHLLQNGRERHPQCSPRHLLGRDGPRPQRQRQAEDLRHPDRRDIHLQLRPPLHGDCRGLHLANRLARGSAAHGRRCAGGPATPIAEQTVELVHGFPFVELGDYYQFSANGRHYDADQKLAVYSFSHTAQDGYIQSSFVCRGKPSLEPAAGSKWKRTLATATRTRSPRSCRPSRPPPRLPSRQPPPWAAPLVSVTSTRRIRPGGSSTSTTSTRQAPPLRPRAGR